MNKMILPFLVSLGFLGGCSDSSNEIIQSGFDKLLQSSTDYVEINGTITFWMYEGDGGCFGSISKGGDEIQLWVGVDACGEHEYKEGEIATFEITFNSENQYGPGKTYTITEFR